MSLIISNSRRCKGQFALIAFEELIENRRNFHNFMTLLITAVPNQGKSERLKLFLSKILISVVNGKAMFS